MRLLKICPKTHRIIGVRSPGEVPRYLFPVAGFLALVWFLVRVLPKPSRATYPCQRLAAPLAGSFLMWLAGITGGSLLLHQARLRLRQARYLTAVLALVGALVGIAWSALSLQQPVRAAYTPHPANSPIGTAKGLLPGRVAWAHDPLVTDWNGTATSASQSWFNHISQTEATNLMQWALLGYAGTTTTSAAWDAMFHNFNGGSAGYQSGEKIFIKINLTTSQADACADSSYNWVPSACGTSWNSVGHSPQLMVALLDQLVNVVGAAQSDITIGDPTGLWVNELYNPVHNIFPNVKYLDARGTLGRTKATKSTTRLYWSTSEADGKNPDYLLQAVVDARYMINFSVLKSHERNGITVAAKNHFGSLSGGNDNVRKPPTTGYYNIHLRLPMETAADAWPQRASMAQYRPLVDLNGHTGMGGKTLLYLIDGTFGGRGWSGAPSKWAMAPFNDNWPCSLFVSMDEVAIDSMAFDFLSQQFPTEALGNEGVQDYLHEMALADNPPSGTFYDPEGDGIQMTSQGVHEHWNNATQKQYTRNLGTGNGIELVYINSAPAPTFSDVPYDYSVTYGGVVYPLHDTIQALYDAGYTSGCSTNPLSYCPDNTLTRVEAAVFMLRGLIGTSYAPPTDPGGYIFTDDWSSPTVSWGQPWAERMWDEGLTSGCSADPRLFCPTTTLTRAEASVFGLRIENGAGYTPPAASHIFADDWSSSSVSWAEPWAEQAYLNGLLPACGEYDGKPLFCPSDLVTRAWAAYLVVEAKDLPVTP